MVSLPVTIQTLYAELVEQLLALDARRTIGHVPGSFVTKKLARGIYYYFLCTGRRRVAMLEGRRRRL